MDTVCRIELCLLLSDSSVFTFKNIAFVKEKKTEKGEKMSYAGPDDDYYIPPTDYLEGAVNYDVNNDVNNDAIYVNPLPAQASWTNHEQRRRYDEPSHCDPESQISGNRSIFRNLNIQKET